VPDNAIFKYYVFFFVRDRRQVAERSNKKRKAIIREDVRVDQLEGNERMDDRYYFYSTINGEILT